ncbi:MAG: DapH/DapD/GlmU-related protein [Aureispira sp.]
MVIGDHCWIGANVYTREGITIGNHVIICANSVVTKDILDGAILGGVPAKTIKLK